MCVFFLTKNMELCFICGYQELAAKLRAILLLKRQFDDVPAQTELIQYVSCFYGLKIILPI